MMAATALQQRKVPSKGPSESAPTAPEKASESGSSEQWLKRRHFPLFAVLTCAPALTLLFALRFDPGAQVSILINLAMSAAGFFLTVWLIPIVMPYMLRRNMFGYDINKRGSPGGEIRVPEALGLVVGIVYIVIIILFQHFYFTPDSAWLVEYNAALAAICFMILLGFVDDVLDIPWRVKIILPSFAALPLLMAYAGHTTIVIPKPLRAVLGVEALDLGSLYKLYMGLLVVFCSNAINILAGVNGLEAGQTAVIAGAILVHNLWQIGGVSGWKHAIQEDMQQAHLFSIYLMQPFLATTLGLLYYNWFPSKVFVGDTFTYFAGMTMAVVGILGHFSETLLLFFLPQIINFLYSIPQLLKIVPCPRHRLPKFDPETKLLTGSNDLNLVNLFLRVFGPCTEQALCIRLLLFQVLSCGLCFGVRAILTGVYK